VGPGRRLVAGSGRPGRWGALHRKPSGRDPAARTHPPGHVGAGRGQHGPDTPYYLPRRLVAIDAAGTHSLTGALGLDALLGLLAFVFWHGLLAGPALAAAPRALQERLPTEATRSLRERFHRPADLVLVYLSLVVGALTHVVWDAFTHRARWGVQHVPWLSAQHGRWPGYEWAQLASGLLGGLALAIALVLWWRRTPPVRAEDRRSARSRAGRGGRLPAGAAWAAIALAGLVGALVGTRRELSAPGGPDLLHAGFLAATRGTVLAGAIAVVLALGWHLARRFGGPAR
jgi:hypothetical protein